MAARRLLSTFCVTRSFLTNLYITPTKFLSITSSRLYSVDATSSESSSDSDESSEDNQLSSKYKILKASMTFVPEFGWSKKSLTFGAEAVGLPPLAHGMIEGPAELINYFYQDCNEKLAKQLKQEIQSLEERNEKLHKTEFIRSAVEKRLHMILPYIDIWPQAMAIQTLPQNAGRSWRNLLDLVDEIWYHAGDRSTDFNWYTKRVSLAAVYKSTEIVMLQDKSEDYEETANFLHRRIHDLIGFSSVIHNSNQISDQLSDGLKGALIMGQNVLGMNSRSR